MSTSTATKQPSNINKEEFEQLVERSANIIAIFGADRRFRYINIAFREAMGVNPEYVIGKTVPEAQKGSIKALEFEKALDTTFETMQKGAVTLTADSKQGIRSYRIFFVPFIENGIVCSVAAFFEDITDLLAVEDDIARGKERLENIVETVPDGIMIFERNGRVSFVNNAVEKIFGISRDKLLGRFFNDPGWRLTYFDGQLVSEDEMPFTRVMRTGKPIQGIEHAIERPDGTRAMLSINAAPFLDENGKINGMIASITDITIKKQTENELLASERRFKDVINSAPFGAHLYELAEDGRLIFSGSNPACDKILGVDCLKFVGKTIEEAFPPLVATPIPEAYRKTALTGAPFDDVQVQYDDQKITGAFEVHAFQTAPRRMAVLFRDVTERQKAEEALQRSEERYRSMVEVTSDWIWEVNENYIYTYSSPNVKDILGFEPNEILGKTPIDLMPREEAQRIGAELIEMGKKREKLNKLENVNIHKDGHLVTLETSAVPFFSASGEFKGYRGIDRDITERKKAKEDLQRSEERYRTMVEVSSDWIWEVDEDYRYTYSSPKAMEILGYEREELLGKTPFDIMPPEEAEHLKKILFEIGSKHKSFHRMENTNLHKDGRRIVLETNAVPIFSSKGDFKGYRGIDRDITERKLAEIELKTSYEMLVRSTEGIITSISEIVETRDPYTAGHQRRVGQLAYAIAMEMGLPEKQAKVIHTAGLLHDVGKINVPSEILSKPGRLNSIEYDLIRTHPYSAYRILQNITFSAPIAEIAYQHQERLNGSGYPRALKTDQILLETKIISVADTVEAMSFARPYRSVIGLDKALDELRKGKGQLFDPQVVDACFAVFEKNIFKFEEYL